MNENKITISVESYMQFAKAKFQIDAIKSVVKKDKGEYGLSCDTDRFILSILEIEKESEPNV